ncbi:hypothetical protein Tco_0460729, partial [Tanacetum coccineum]
EEQPLPAAASPTADSPGYVHESDPEEDDEDPEEDPACWELKVFLILLKDPATSQCDKREVSTRDINVD